MNKSLAKVFGEVLKELRSEVGISQENLAYESELDRSYISLLERGLRIPSITILFQIAKPLQKTPSEILLIVEERYKLL